MKIYVVTKNDETVAVMDNEVSGALHFSDDEFHRYLDNGASTFDLTVAKKHRIYSNATDIEMEDFQYLVANNFLIFTYKNKDYKFTIRRVEETETSIRLFCEDLSFDLLNEYRGPYIADKAYNIAKYVNDCLYDSGYTIGINEFAKNTRTLKWEGDDTVLKRLLSICNSFDAELEFETQLNNDRTVNKQLVHLRKRVGLNRPDIELKYGREVSSIRRNVDLTELITAIKPRGHENDGKYVTIKNVAKEVKDADGNVAYFTKKGSEYLYAPMANQTYGSPEKKSGGYIVGQFSYDTESDTELYNRALTELQLKCMPAYEYEIEGFYDVDIGDTVRAIDEAYNPILMLEARISEQTISFSDLTKNKTVYSNYRILENKVSKSLLDRIDEVKKYAEQVAKTYIFSISNVGSPMFRNGEGEVIFTAKIEKNNQDFTDEFNEFNWIKQKKDGSLDSVWNEAHKNFGKTLTVKPEDFEDTATFSYEALEEDLSIGGASGVVTKVYDGEDGNDGVGIASDPEITYQGSASGTNKPTGTWSTTIPEVPAGQFLWTKTVTTYTNNTNSTAYTVAKMGSDGKPGSNGVSVSSVAEEYYVSTSAIEQTGGEWSTTVPNNANPNLYVWRRVKTTMSNGTVTYTNPALIQGMTGIYPYIGPTQPANPKEEQQWWKSDASGNVTNFYVYKSGSWQGQTIQQSVLNIIALNAVTITGSTITGTTINGSTLNSTGTMQSGSATLQYATKITGITEITWEIPGTTQNGVIKMQPDGIYATSWNDAAKNEPLWAWSIDSAGLYVASKGRKSNLGLPNVTRYGPSGISIANEDFSGSYGDVNLEYQDLMTMPQTQLTPATGFEIYSSSSTNKPTAKRTVGRVITLAGAFKNTKTIDSTSQVKMGTLPVWACPPTPQNFLVQGSGMNRYLIWLNPNGDIMMERYGSTTSSDSVAVGAWLNIACVYSAGDL